MKQKKKKEAEKETNVAAEMPLGAAHGLPEAEEPVEAPASASAEEETVPRERLLRLQADFDNYRKRMQREREDLGQRMNEALITDLLPVLDHFHMGLENAERQEADAGLRNGFQLVLEQAQAVLNRYGLEMIDAAGQTFDPHQHEALTHLPSAEHPAGQVLAQTRRGYRLGGKLLRAAQVVVSSGPPENAEAEEVRPAAAGEDV